MIGLIIVVIITSISMGLLITWLKLRKLKKQVPKIEKEVNKDGKKNQQELTNRVQMMESQMMMENQKNLLKDETQYRLMNLQILDEGVQELKKIAKQLHSLNQQIYSHNELFAKSKSVKTEDGQQKEQSEQTNDIPEQETPANN